MTEPDSSPEDLVAGLDLGHMNPPDIVAFFGGLPRRVAAVLVPDDENDDASAGDDQSVTDDDSAIDDDEEEAPTLPVDEMNAVADTLQRLIDRTKSVGFSLEPEATAKGVDDSTLEALPPEAESALRRIETGATELARRLSGLPSAAWRTNEDLLADARAAVAEAVGPLRAIERSIDDRGDGG